MASAAHSLDNPTMLLLTSRTTVRLSGRLSRSMKSMRCSVPFSKTRRSAAATASTARDESLCFTVTGTVTSSTPERKLGCAPGSARVTATSRAVTAARMGGL